MNDQHDDAIEVLLRKQFDGSVPDAGFCDRVMRELPPHRRPAFRPLGVGILMGVVACWLTFPLLHIGPQNRAGGELSTPAIVMLLVAMGMTLLASLWAMTEADDR